MINRATMLAVAGVSAGAATIAVAPAQAFAAPAPAATPVVPTAATHTAWHTASQDGGPSTTLPVPRKNGGGAVTAAADPPCNAVARFNNANGEHLFTPLANNGSGACNLSFGASGAPVTKVQDSLRLCYHKDLGPTGSDGQWGNLTQNAIRDVRASKGLGNPQDYDGALVRAGFLYPVYNGSNAFTGRCDTPFV
jgi:hypothetical protein